MWGQMAADLPFRVRHPASRERRRDRRAESSSIVRLRSPILCSTSVRTCEHGACPARFKATIALISSRLKPSRRARAMKARTPTGVVTVKPIPARRPGCRRQDPGSFVESESLPTHATPRGNLSDPHVVAIHNRSLNPAPWGKVKRQTGVCSLYPGERPGAWATISPEMSVRAGTT